MTQGHMGESNLAEAFSIRAAGSFQFITYLEVLLSFNSLEHEPTQLGFQHPVALQ